MSVILRAVALTIVVSCSVFLVVAATSHQALAASDSDACPAFERRAQLSSRPFQVNPGGKCYSRMRFSVRLHAANAEPPEVCHYARMAGSDKVYGPFCGRGGVRLEVPGPIEWIWTNWPVTLYYKLCDTAAECRK